MSTPASKAATKSLLLRKAASADRLAETYAKRRDRRLLQANQKSTPALRESAFRDVQRYERRIEEMTATAAAARAEAQKL